MKRRITQNRSTSVTLDAPPGVSLRGGADSITPRSAIKSGDVTYMVKITLADSDPRLQWGYDGPRRRSGQQGRGLRAHRLAFLSLHFLRGRARVGGWLSAGEEKMRSIVLIIISGCSNCSGRVRSGHRRRPTLAQPGTYTTTVITVTLSNASTGSSADDQHLLSISRRPG